MDHRLLALQLLKSKPDAVTGVEHTQIDYQELAVGILLKFVDVLEGVAIIIAGIFLMRLARGYFTRIQTTHERQKTALNLLEKITSGFIIVVSITLGLKVIGLDLTLLVSVMTLGLSFGLGDVVKNYVAGLLILFKSPFELGDVVNIRTFTGKIEKIEFQSVTLRTFDQKVVTIQNSDLLTQPITNFSKAAQARLEISLTLGYGSDVSRALKIFDRILQNHAAVLKSPRYSIVFKEFKQLGVDVLIRFWVQKPANSLKIRSELALKIQESFDEENLIAPYSRQPGESTFGMTEARKQRLKVFYGQPMLADIATQTLEQVAAAAMPNGTGIPVVAEEYIDADEPE